MIEIKLSQGAKPGHGGVLPGAKVTAEIAAIRGVEAGKDCISPARHGEFSTPIEMMDFIARLRAAVRRQAGRLQALHRPSVGIPGDLQGDAGDRHLSRFHRRRRQGGRHRRGAAGIHRPSRHADARGAQFRPQRAGRLGAARLASASAPPARSSPPSTWPARWRSAPTGATRRAASCSRSAASSR